MAIHPKLKPLPNIKYRKVFSKLLKGIDKDLNSLGIIEYEVEVTAFDSSKSFFGRFLDHGFNEPKEIMSIYTEYQGCAVEIVICLTRKGIYMPYFIFVELPLPIQGQAEYRGGTFGNKWHYSPKNISRKKDLKRTLPKVQMMHATRQGLVYSIKIGQVLEASEDGTIWSVQAGYEGGAFSSKRPRPSRFLKAIPSVEAMLGKWNEGK